VNTPAPKAQEQSTADHQVGKSSIQTVLARPPRELLEPPSDGRLGREELDRDGNGNLIL
jgi:hypothetical protein